MAVFKQVSIKIALRKIMSDLGYTRVNSKEFPWQDSIEWIAEALGQIGAYTQYDAKEVTLKIVNFKAKLPCDFIHLKRLRNGDAYQPKGFTNNNNTNLLDNNTDTLDEKKERFIGNSITNFDYNIVMDNVITSYKEGAILLQYLAMPVDEEGFPVIPDNEAYKEAFFWKVARQLAIRGTLPNKEINFQMADAQWQWYCGQARAEANAFTHEQLDYISADMNSILPLNRMLDDKYGSSTAVVSSFETYNDTDIQV